MSDQRIEQKNVHSRHCLKDHEPHVEISNMMFQLGQRRWLVFCIIN